jgi:DNA polymerase zeta
MCYEMLITVEPLCYYVQELERLRLLEETKYADLVRPLREEVLKDFLHGIKYESALSVLFSQEGPHHKVSTIEESERLERCLKSLTDIIGTVTFSQDDYCGNIDVGNSADVQNDKPNASLCSGSLEQNMQIISPERKSEYPVSSSVPRRTLSQLSDEGEKVVSAPQILVTLSWFASNHRQLLSCSLL